MFQFILAMYIASANGLYVPDAIQVAAWVMLGIQMFILPNVKRR